MDFRAAIRFPFLGEKRWSTLACALVCFLIPIVGPMVLIGYGTLIEKQLIENLQASARPFDFGRFTDYLKRGIAPFVVSLIMVPVMWILMIPLVAIVIVGVITSNHLKSDGLMIATVIVGILLYIVTFSIAMLLMAPVSLKAALEQTIGGAFDRVFILGYIRRVGLPCLGYSLLLMLLILLIFPFSICLPIVGPYAIAAIFMFAQWHLQAQFYLLYLERGGIPLNIQPEAPPPAFPVSPAPPEMLT